MPIRSFLSRASRPSLSLVLLVLFLAILWLAGGASRADVSGQVVVRGAAWGLLAVLALFGPRPSFHRAKPVCVLLAAAAALAAIQLVPLPPSLWQALPGRALLSEASTLAGDPQPWRPWSIVPGATVNALASLVVPFTTLILLGSLGRNERDLLPGIILCLIVASAVMGAFELSGSGFDNPLINDSPGQVSGTFANRNHLALFLSFGCLLAPAWALREGRRPGWRASLGLGFILMFCFLIVAVGSRAGLVLGLVAVGIGMVVVRQRVRREFRNAPRWMAPVLIAFIVAIIAALILASIVAGRAETIVRMVASDPMQDLRSRELPTILAMIWTYFPFGSGIGGFDPIFRIHEPFDLLALTYFNHAHNDFLEIVLDAGLPGFVLLACALGWWAVASARAWRPGARGQLIARLGSAILLLVFIASAFDYSARTPMIMAMIVIAAWWLSSGGDRAAAPALPPVDQRL